MRGFNTAVELDTSFPSTVTEPSDGFKMPQMVRMVVVLPAPLAPKKPKISPRRTSKLTPSTAWKSPNATTRFFTLITISFSFMVQKYLGKIRYAKVFHHVFRRAGGQHLPAA